MKANSSERKCNTVFWLKLGHSFLRRFSLHANVNILPNINRYHSVPTCNFPDNCPQLTGWYGCSSFWQFSAILKERIHGEFPIERPIGARCEEKKKKGRKGTATDVWTPRFLARLWFWFTRANERRAQAECMWTVRFQRLSAIILDAIEIWLTSSKSSSGDNIHHVTTLIDNEPKRQLDYCWRALSIIDDKLEVAKRTMEESICRRHSNLRLTALHNEWTVHCGRSLQTWHIDYRTKKYWNGHKHFYFLFVDCEYFPSLDDADFEKKSYIVSLKWMKQ